MPQFDESFLSDAKRHNVLSYSVVHHQNRHHYDMGMGLVGDAGSSLPPAKPAKLYERRKLRTPKYFLTYTPRPRVVIKNFIRYNTISSPSTPHTSSPGQLQHNGGYSASSGGGTPNTPSPATPSTTPLGTPSPQTPGGTSGHKNSLKGTKLARRARSFKDDLIEKISQMRTPTNTLGRSHSPHSIRNRHGHNKAPPTAEDMAKSAQSLDTHLKHISNALKHFRDVISRKKLEVLPGNGTVILESIASMFAVIHSYTLNEHCEALKTASEQVYSALGNLIKLCDEVMLSDSMDECCPSLNNDNVKEVVDELEKAAKNLVVLAQRKLSEKEENMYKYGGNAAGNGTNQVGATTTTNSGNTLMRPAVEVAGQRTSLPDITLTPKERDILEKTNSNPIRASHSTESILRDTSPPPKPPLPNRSNIPPPLPPKQHRNYHNHQANQQNSHNTSMNSDLNCSSEVSLINYPVERLSVRSRSPDENSSQCSLDSALNTSREEDKRYDDDFDNFYSLSKTSATAATTASRLNDASATDCRGGGDKESGLSPSVSVAASMVTTPTTTAASPEATAATATIKLSPSGSTSPQAAVAAGLQNVATATIMAGTYTNCNNTNSHGTSTNANNETDRPPKTPNEADLMLQEAITATAINTTTNNVGGGDGGDGGGGVAATTATVTATTEKPEMRAPETTTTNNRHSNESGYLSINSFRESTQSVSKRSSDYSFQSSSKSSNSEVAFSSGLLGESQSSEFHHFQQNSSSHMMSTVYAGGAGIAATTTTTMENHHHHQQHLEQHLEEHVLTSPTTIASSSTFTKSNSLVISSSEEGVTLRSRDIDDDGEGQPPALPPKIYRNRLSAGRMDSTDNAADVHSNFSASSHDLPELRHHPPHHYLLQPHMHQKCKSWAAEPRLGSSCNAIGTLDDGKGGMGDPPPLPEKKKKHILAYMEICSSTRDYRHTLHTTVNRNITHSQTMNIVPLTKDLTPPEHEIPPALPPKNYKPRVMSALPPTIITTPPPSPKPHGVENNNCVGGASSGSVTENGARYSRVLTGGTPQGSEMMSTVCEESSGSQEEGEGDMSGHLHQSHELPNVAPSGEAGGKSPDVQRRHMHSAPICTPDLINDEDEGIDVVLQNHNYNNNNNNNNKKNCSLSQDPSMPSLLEELDIGQYLILKKENEDGPEIKGGYLDALIVHACGAQKVSDKAFTEAFITTFRTFIQPVDLIEKLIHRYTNLVRDSMNDHKQKAANETFSLLVRVVNDLTTNDLSSPLLTLLLEFDVQLICSGQLYQVKLLRNKMIEKVNVYKELKMPIYVGDGSILHSTTTNPPGLLDLKSVEIAEQMTLLDAELFQKIEIPEVLLFAKEQCEEKSPNLNVFTEHFNKMSYWARSKILRLPDAKDRERHVVKFIKIMKHLRKMNNYNSYLALLSALDSAPIRRLEWHKQITEGLREYCTLIDSSSSFRMYRQALAETQPPCIPYIGLVLQDLTFVHVGNPDYLKDGVINFSKRWQQYNIIVNMKRFKKCAYPFRRNERIIQYFDNFEDFLGEEEMWNISESIKPRGKRIAVHS